MLVQRFERFDVRENDERVDDLIVCPLGLDVAGVDESCREPLQRIDPSPVVGDLEDLGDVGFVAGNVERGAQPVAHLGEHATVRSKKLSQRNERVGKLTCLVDASDPGRRQDVPRNGFEQTDLRPEMPVHGGSARPGPRRDVFDRDRMETRRGHQLGRHVEDPPAGCGGGILASAEPVSPGHVRRPGRPRLFMLHIVILNGRSGMTTAQQIVVVYGVMSLMYGFGLGIPLSRERMAAPAASRHLVIAHLSAILQGAMYLGLSAAFAMSTLTSSLETSAAVLLVCGSVLFVTGATLNWRQQIGDHFAERSPGWRCFALSSVGHLVGMTLVLVGVVTGI